MSAVLHTLRYLCGLDAGQTQTTPTERQCLAGHIAGRRRAVEIGVFEGVTTGVLAAAMGPSGTLYAVDPFFVGRLGICWSMTIARAEVRRARGARVQFVRALSTDAALQLDGEFDFLLIDGDHSLDGIRQDWAAWADRISPGGIVALHDTSVPAHNPNVATLGSVAYFESTISRDPRYAFVERVDSLNVLRRREPDRSM